MSELPPTWRAGNIFILATWGAATVILVANLIRAALS